MGQHGDHRFGVRLRHAFTIPGLEFADSVNIALFVLTIVSLGIAVYGVHIAVATMDIAVATMKGADAIAAEQRTAAQRAADDAHAKALQDKEDQSKQFQKQMKQLTKASTLLNSQLIIAQTNAEIASWKPHPSMFVSCSGQTVLDSEQQTGDRPRILHRNLWWSDDMFHDIECHAVLRNTGKAELEKATLRVDVTPVPPCTRQNLVVTNNDEAHTIFQPGGVAIFENLDVPPETLEGPKPSRRFQIKPKGQCDAFIVSLEFSGKGVRSIPRLLGQVTTTLNPRDLR